ncbi:MAG: hypothetical protein K8J09_22025 [Planctomycetes bacterium]|nr:hypothetical protein [Planctomycetota bacterium]
MFGPGGWDQQWVVPQVEAAGEGAVAEPNAATGENGEEAAELETINRSSRGGWWCRTRRGRGVEAR